MTEQRPSTQNEPSNGALSRGLGFGEIWAIGVGAVIGDGIFLLIGQGAQIAGPFSLVAYAAAGLILMCIMLSMGEMAVGMPDAGATWVWNRRLLGNLAGFIAGMCDAAGWIIAGGSVGLAIGTISNWFLQLHPSPEVSTVIWALIWITVFAVVNYVGVSLASRTQLAMVLVLVGIMLAFGIVGFLSGRVDVANYVPFIPNGWGSFFPALALGTYAYMGALTLATAGSEARNPADLPRALAWSSVTFLVVYSLAMAAMLGLVSHEQLSVSESPFTTAAELTFGPAAAAIINTAAWLAAATCLLGGTMYAAPRLMYSMGLSGILPGFFANLNKYRVPGKATALVWLISVVLVLLGARNPDLIYVTLSLLLVFCWVVTWLLGLVSAIRYRSVHADEVASLPWHQPLYPLMPVIGFIGLGVILYGTFRGSESALIWGLVFLAALVVYYYAYGRTHLAQATDRGVPAPPTA